MWSSERERGVLKPNVIGRIAVLLAGCALAASLGACATDGASAAGPDPVTPTERYAIEVQPHPEEMRLAIHAAGVSANQTHVLGDFVRRWMDSGGGEITVQSPTRGADPGAAYRTTATARDVLTASGVAPEKIRIVGYDAAGQADAPVIVGYTRYAAKGPQCGHAWENLSSTHQNREYNNFGCAVTANVAAQIADPADLLTAREMTDPDAARRAAVLEHYRKGETTSSAKDSQADGAISRVVP